MPNVSAIALTRDGNFSPKVAHVFHTQIQRTVQIVPGVLFSGDGRETNRRPGRASRRQPTAINPDAFRYRFGGFTFMSAREREEMLINAFQIRIYRHRFGNDSEQLNHGQVIQAPI